MRISQGQRKARPRTRAGQDQQSDKAAWPTQANTGRPGPTQAGQGLHWQAAVNMGRPMATQAGQGQHKQARAAQAFQGQHQSQHRLTSDFSLRRQADSKLFTGGWGHFVLKPHTVPRVSSA